MKLCDPPSLERLREVFDCDPIAGTLRWKIRIANNVRVGDIAGRLISSGYRQVRLDGCRYVVHLATSSQNKMNEKRRADNKCGFKGVRFRNGRWIPRIKIGDKRLDLGSFATAEEAHAAYVRTAEKHFGQFARAA